MKATLIALGAAALGASIAPTSLAVAAKAYGEPTLTLGAEAARYHAVREFHRADLDRSGALDADEHAALAIVTAELTALNGFVAFETAGAPATVTLPMFPEALSRGERARIEAVARGEFYAAAGADGLMTPAERSAELSARFAAADRNRDGVLAKAELRRFAARAALKSRPGA